MSIGAARAAIDHALAGIDASAVFIIAIVALVNTMRRSFQLHPRAAVPRVAARRGWVSSRASA